jgi:hypothetical protein
LVRDPSNLERTLFLTPLLCIWLTDTGSSSLLQNSLCGAAHSTCPVWEVRGSDWLVWRERVDWN